MTTSNSMIKLIAIIFLLNLTLSRTVTYDLNNDRSNSFQANLKGISPLVFLDSSSDKDKCESRDNSDKSDFYWFFPVLKASLKPDAISATFTNKCFQNNKVILEKYTLQETIISLEVSDPVDLWCTDYYIISTTSIHQVESIFFKGVHKIILQNLTNEDMADIQVNGLNILGFCQGFFTEIVSLIDTIQLFFGGFGSDNNSWLPFMRPEVPDEMAKANADFYERYTGYKQVPRDSWADKVIDIDEKEIKSGDFIAITRLDGVDPLIGLGTGSRIGHSAMAMWIDGELYILESQDGWYWPRHGIQKNKWSDWVQWAHNADFLVAILPLKQEYRDKYDEAKAMEYYKTLEGLNYGYHNFVFSWLDTEKENWPAFVDHQTIFAVLTMFQSVNSQVADMMFGQGLNFRLGTKGLTMTQAILLAATKGISVGNLFAMPEVQGWEYSDGQNFVCSCFVVAMWKAGGIFGDLHILPNEFGPHDTYKLAIFDREYKDRRPQACKDADPDLEYCQIMGKYQIVVNHYSSIEPYDHMNERCASMAPDFIRPDGC